MLIKYFSWLERHIKLSLAHILNPHQLLIISVAFFITCTGNYALFSRIVKIYPLTDNLWFVASLLAFFFISSCLLLLIFAQARWGAWVLAIFLLAAAVAGFYMDNYGVIIDGVMLENIFQTNPHEVAALMSVEFFVRLLILGIIPAYLVLWINRKLKIISSSIRSSAYLCAVYLIMMVLLIIPFSSDYADFIREHRTVRFYANPSYFTYSLFGFVKQNIISAPRVHLHQVAEDAHQVIPATNQDKKKLYSLVVGETARADRFSLNGYHRLTNPLLAQQQVISFKQVSSCGTSTSVSVPCMFSKFKRKEFDLEKNVQYENVLDVLKRNGVSVLWRDNNSDSKGVAIRHEYQDFKTPTLNPMCDDECRDIGMLAGLDQYIKKNQHHDMLIVLHQMGNHGPEYYRRYPKSFIQFKPLCHDSRLSRCSQQEIDNAYDNAILYTDYFLSSTIDFLKKYDNSYQTAMLYVSDHGESLGEYDIYLHAAPYMIAPKEQTHVPAILWVGKQFKFNLDFFKQFENHPITHSDLFCSLLTSYLINTKMCDAFHSDIHLK